MNSPLAWTETQQNNRLQPAKNCTTTRQSSHSSNNPQRPARRPKTQRACSANGLEKKSKSTTYPNEPAAECSLTKEMKIEEGTREDWQKLSNFHYRGHGVSVPRKIFRLVRNDELCGVIVYTYPPPACYGRRLVLPRMTMQEINKQLSTINRVVIHPKYRTIGLGAKLISETLPIVGTPYVEMIAVMAKYSPFAEKAGMQKVAEQQSNESVSKVSKVLLELGFDLQLLGSERYVTGKLEGLSPEQMQT